MREEKSANYFEGEDWTDPSFIYYVEDNGDDGDDEYYEGEDDSEEEEEEDQEVNAAYDEEWGDWDEPNVYGAFSPKGKGKGKQGFWVPASPPWPMWQSPAKGKFGKGKGKEMAKPDRPMYAKSYQKGDGKGAYVVSFPSFPKGKPTYYPRPLYPQSPNFYAQPYYKPAKKGGKDMEGKKGKKLGSVG